MIAAQGGKLRLRCPHCEKVLGLGLEGAVLRRRTRRADRHVELF